MNWKLTFPSKQSYSLRKAPESFADLQNIVNEKQVQNNSFEYCLKYIDSDDEFINLNSEEDFTTAVLSAQTDNLHTLEILVLQTSQCDPKAQSLIENSNISTKESENISFESDQTPSKARTRSRFSSSYIPGRILPIHAFRNRLSRISQTQVGVQYLAVPGHHQRCSSCDAKTKKCSNFQPISSPTTSGDYLSTISKLTEDQLDFRVQKEIGHAIPIIVSALRKASVIKSPYANKEEKEPSDRPVCCNCNKSLKSVKYICANCLDDGASNKSDDAEKVAVTRTKAKANSCKACKKVQPFSVVTPTKLDFSNDGSISASHRLLHQKDPSNDAQCDYKVSIIRTRNPEEGLKLKPEEHYKTGIQLKNSGTTQWPDDVRLICINGPQKGIEKKLPSLEPERDIDIELSMQAPKEEGRYLLQWRISYGRGTNKKSFGESWFEKIYVKETPIHSDNSPKVTRETQFDSEKLSRSQDRLKESRKLGGTRSSCKVPNAITCQEDRVRYAEYLNDIFPGSLTEKMAFTSKLADKATIFEVVDQYLMNLGNSNVQVSQDTQLP